jgi:TfoX/Sxy family transcriptional regulator of competence genes
MPEKIKSLYPRKLPIHSKYYLKMSRESQPLTDHLGYKEYLTYTRKKSINVKLYSLQQILWIDIYIYVVQKD